jgi:hypothetical protein
VTLAFPQEMAQAFLRETDAADIRAPLPDIATLHADRQSEVARWIRGHLRPALMSRLSHLLAAAESDTDTMLDRLELDLRLQQVNAYAAELDALIGRHTPPVPSERMPIRLHDLRIEPDLQVSARTELYFSPTTKYFVHGPDALRYALDLAERLLRPGEAFEELEVAHWRRIMLSNLHLSVRVRDPAHEAPAAMRSDPTTSMSGTIRTTAGRRLDYRGEALAAYPIFEESGYNESALEMLRPLRWVKVDGRNALHLSLPATAPCLAALNRSPSFGLFTLAELLGFLAGLKTEHTPATHLSVRIEGLPVPDRLGDLFRTGITLEYERVFEQARQRLPHTRTVPFRYRFHPFQQEPRDGRMAITDLSISELMALSDRERGGGRVDVR